MGDPHTGQWLPHQGTAVNLEVLVLVEAASLAVVICTPQNHVTRRIRAQSLIEQAATDSMPLAFLHYVQRVDLYLARVCIVWPEDRHAEYPAARLGNPHAPPTATQGLRVNHRRPACRRTEQVEQIRRDHSGPGPSPNRKVHLRDGSEIGRLGFTDP